MKFLEFLRQYRTGSTRIIASGAISVAAPGWALGTCLGILMGEALPVRIVSALSVALYGMFLAGDFAAARKNRVIAGVVVISMLLSAFFFLGSGFVRHFFRYAKNDYFDCIGFRCGSSALVSGSGGGFQ